jgi:phosphate transport system permease protein
MSAGALAPGRRARREQVVETLTTAMLVATALVGVVALAALLATILQDGLSRLTFDFLRDPPSRRPSVAGFSVAVAGSLWVMGIVIVVAIPLGVAAAVHLEEFAPRNRLTQLVEVNIDRKSVV